MRDRTGPAALRFLLLAVPCLLLSACGGGGSGAPAGGGGSVLIGLAGIGSLDPPLATSSSAQLLLRTACDGLVGLDPESGVPKPALAEKWEVQEGARRLNIRLREDMTFQDGTPVNAAAVREALSRVARPATASSWASLVAVVDGFDAVRDGQATHLSGVRAVGELSLEIDLDEPFSDFPTVLSHTALRPVSLESLHSNPEGPVLPVCAGPYRIEEGLEPGDYRLARSPAGNSRNDAFAEHGSGLADRLLVRAYESPEDAYEAYKSGLVDIAPVPDSRLNEAQAAGEGYHSGVTPEITFLAFDPAQPATADPRLRHALSLAVDRLVIIDAAYGDGRQPAPRWLPAQFGEEDSACTSFARRIADTERAGELLRESGTDPAGLRLPLIYDPNRLNRLVAEALQIQVREALGIDLPPSPLEKGDIAASIATRGEAPAIWIMQTRIDLPLPDRYLGTLFHSGSGSNPIGFADDDFDRQVEEARAATDPAAVQEHYLKAEDVLCELMPAIPLWNSVSHWMINPAKVEVSGDAAFDSSGNPLLRHVRAGGA